MSTRLFTLLTLSLIQLGLHAQDCYEQFDYHQVYNVSAPSGTIEAATHSFRFPSGILVTEGKLQADASDLRITDGACNPLPFYLQNASAHDTNAVYIALPELSTENYELHFYYGSDEVLDNLSNGEAVFEFFDDFEDGELDPLRWETIGQHTEYSETNGELRFTGVWGNGGAFQYAAPLPGRTEATTFDFVANSNNTQVYGIADTTDRQRIGLRYQSGAQSNDTLDIIAYMADTLNGGTGDGTLYPFRVVPRSEMNIISIAAHIDEDQHLVYTRFQCLSNGEENLDSLFTINFEYDVIRPFFASFSSPIRVEFLGMRDTPSQLPAVEIMEPTFIGVSAMDELELPLMRIYPNPAHEQLFFNSNYADGSIIEIYSMSGKLIETRPMAPQIDISALAPGTYMVVRSSETQPTGLGRFTKD